MRVLHMIDAAESVGQFMAGRQRVDLDRDRMLLFAVVRAIEVIGEAASRVSDVFRKTLGPAERSLLSELREHRNKWAHQESFSGDDAYRALDSAGRLLTAVSAPQADEIEKTKMELLRLRFD